jgi:diguanylate cyclase (GGDEF)-like protein/PAS domain S-box-containing protein
MRLYAALSQCNEAIVRCASEEELFLEVCRAAVQFGGMKMAWVGFADTETLRMRLAAICGDDTGYLKDVDISVDVDSSFGRGPTGTAFRENRPYWCQDILKDPVTLPWRERAARAGLAASASLPLQSKGIVVGTFTLYSGEVESFDEPARDLLVKMAADISFALDHFALQSQRRRTEEEIRFKNTILKTQQETSLDAILVVDETGKIMSYNQRFIDLWRLSPELVSARVDAPVLQSVVAQVENPERFTSRVQYLTEHRDDTSREEIPLKDGRTIDRYSAPVTGADRKYYGRVWYFRDITERKKTDQQFKDLLDAAPDAMVIVNRDAEMVLVNLQAVNLFGWQREELLGQKIELLLPERFRGKHPGYVSGFFAQPGARAMGKGAELFGLRKDGSEFPLEGNLSPLQTGEGTVVISAIRDITKRREAEHRIAYLNRVYAMLSSINTLIVHVHDRKKLFEEACRIAVAQGGFRMSLIAMVDQTTKKIVWVASASKDRELMSAIKGILSSSKNAANTMVARVISEKELIVCNDCQNDPGVLFGNKYAEAGVRSMAIFPLLRAQEAIGVLTLYASESEFFHEEELKLLAELAGDISFALENIDRQQKLVKLARVRSVSGAINAAIIRIHDRDELFREACRIAVEAGGFSLAWVAVVDQDFRQLRPVAWEGLGQDYLERIPLGLNQADTEEFGLAGRAVCEKKPMIVEDLQQDPRVLLRADARERGFHSVVTLPLLVSDTVVGVLVLYANEIGFFDDREMKLLLEVAANISFALDHIEKADKLNYLAYYDELTGLANRSLFLERVAQYTRSAASGGHKLGLFLIDLERFKSINDSLGRPAGDALLRQVAEWLTRNAGDAGLVARVGADHFAVVLPVVKQNGDVVRLLEKTMAASLGHPFLLNDAVFRVSAKVGVALFPDDGADADALFRNAEAALKKAKASGEPYLFHTQKMTEMIAGKLTLENQLRQALDNQEFVLHYQPKVNLVSGKLTGAEALIRWNDPRTGLVPPGRFIPMLEETGLIHDVGRWALRQAIEDYLRWRRAGLASVRIAVNVSPLQLRNRGFIDEIKQAIGIEAQAATGLELEITESVIMEDIKRNIASLQAIRALGVTVAIDDFGTGFSSLSYLAKLPVDTLKIDRSFVVDMTVAPEGLALVSTIIDLAHSLKLKVVAEGVETEEQARLLRLLNCDEMQGFLFSKAVPAEIFETRFLAAPPAG